MHACVKNCRSIDLNNRSGAPCVLPTRMGMGSNHRTVTRYLRMLYAYDLTIVTYIKLQIKNTYARSTLLARKQCVQT